VPRYQKVLWDHDLPGEPVVLYSEVADYGAETRKVEVFHDGHSQFADSLRSSGDTLLSEIPFPSLEEIHAQTEFLLSEIGQQEFEEVWRRATGESGGQP
jgi:hypothetical protein